MQEVIIARWCDVCWQDGEQKTESAGGWTVGIISGSSGSRPALKLLELCEQHSKLITDVAEILSEVDATPDYQAVVATKAAATPRTTPKATPVSNSQRLVSCPVCANAVGRSSLVTHIWGTHRRDTRPAQPTTCPECGERYDDPRGMATHRRLGHGYDAVIDALGGVKGYKVTGHEGGL